jgi:hypothetical protein
MTSASAKQVFSAGRRIGRRCGRPAIPADAWKRSGRGFAHPDRRDMGKGGNYR